jgi:hypothetical protein
MAIYYGNIQFIFENVPIDKTTVMLERTTSRSNPTTTKTPFLSGKDLIKKRFSTRREHLIQACKNEGSIGMESYVIEEIDQPRPNLLYIDKYQIIFCAIPKVCTASFSVFGKLLSSDVDLFYNKLKFCRKNS